MRGASDADSGAESISMQQKSLVDMDEDFSDDSEEVSTVTCYVSAEDLHFVHHSNQNLDSFGPKCVLLQMLPARFIFVLREGRLSWGH